MNSIFTMRDRVVLITGGGGYLGTAMSEIMCELGATTIIGCRSTSKASVLTRRLRSKYGNRVDSIEIDISDAESVKESIDYIIKEYRRIDVLINNAYYGSGKYLHHMTEKDWEKGIDGSINGVFRVTQNVLKHMIVNKYGRIINVASMYGVVAPDVSVYEDNEFYNPANYGVGKAGIIQFTKYIACVYGHLGINCNSISPGPFPNIEVQKNQGFIDQLEKKVPLGRIGKPEELKGVIALLASDASSFINGTNIGIDGGWTAW